MRNQKVREAVLAKYMPTQKKTTLKYKSITVKHSTLEEFYQEVYAKNNFNAEHSFPIFAQNRRLIDAQRTPKR